MTIHQLPCVEKRTRVRSSLIRCVKSTESLRTQVSYKPNLINVSTMTIVGILSTDHIDTDSIFETYKDTHGKHVCVYENDTWFNLSIPENEKAKKKTVRKVGDDIKKTFFNQATLSFRDTISTKSIKIFSNGKIHMTGCKSVYEFAKIARVVCAFLKPFSAGDDDIVLTDFTINLINVNFAIGIDKGDVISLQKVKDLLLLQKIDATYSSDNHAGCIVKYPTPDGQLNSILIFRGGSINLSGIKSFENVEATFDFIVRFINDNYDAIKTVNYSLDQRVKKKTKTIGGVPASIYFNLQL